MEASEDDAVESLDHEVIDTHHIDIRTEEDLYTAYGLDPILEATQRGLGIAVDLEVASRPAVEAGFGVARMCANMGFEFASNFVEFVSTSISVDPDITDNLHSVIRASQYVADVSVTTTRTIATTTLRASTDLFIATGAKEGELWRAIFGRDLARILQKLYHVMTELYDSLDTLSLIEVIQCMDLLRRIELLKSRDQETHMRFIAETLSLDHAIPNSTFSRTIDVPSLQTFLHFSVGAYGVTFCKLLFILPISTTMSVLTDSDCICYFTGIAKEDILDEQLWSMPLNVGYYLALHRPSKSIVVAFKGTNKIDDVLLDLMCKPVPFNRNNSGENNSCCVHEGFVEAAMKFDSLKQQVLDLLTAYPDYRVVLTGHSLGAAIASIVAINWKEDIDAFRTGLDGADDRLICYAFAPPGILSISSPDDMEYIKSVVLGNDIISRASLSSVKNLSRNLVYIRDIGIRKLGRVIANIEGNCSSVEDLKLFQDLLTYFQSNNDQLQLYPVGRVLWVNPDILNEDFFPVTITDQECKAVNNFNCCVCKWIDPSKSLQDIVISMDCVSIHMPNAWLAVFEKLNRADVHIAPVSPDNQFCFHFESS